MKVMTWAPELATGFADMDEQHRAMIGTMQKICSTDDSRFEAAFREFVANVESDFRSEEAMMEMMRYAGAKAHCEHHARTLSALHHTLGKVMQGDIDSGRETVELLFQWFTVHIETMDRALAFAYIKS